MRQLARLTLEAETASLVCGTAARRIAASMPLAPIAEQARTQHCLCAGCGLPQGHARAAGAAPIPRTRAGATLAATALAPHAGLPGDPDLARACVRSLV